MCVFAVAPLAGAWIEIELIEVPAEDRSVAPLAGAWIEIMIESNTSTNIKVAPLAGAWIEISSSKEATSANKRRSPRGSVD